MMDYFIHLDALDSVALSGTRADGWYLDEAKAAMEAGEITYAGKYSAPDYECILAAHCSLAIEKHHDLPHPGGQGAAGTLRGAGAGGALQL